jgi:hypothetical protein
MAVRRVWEKNVETALGCPIIRAMIRFGEMENRLKDSRKLIFFQTFRWMERRLPVRSLFWIFGGYACVRSALRRKLDPSPLPACLAAGRPGQVISVSRIQCYLNQMLEYVPERLAEPKWMSRCRIEGLDPVLRARQDKRPVVLAFVHSSAYRLSRFWLRAAGVPAASLIAGKAENRPNLDRLGDGFSPFPEIPNAFYLDQLREANEFLAAGNALLVAIDAGAVKRVDLPVGEGWTFQMAAGAVRLAIRHRAELIPLVLIDEGHWHYHIKLGRPVPPEYLTAEADWTQAGKHLLDEMLPHFRQHPQQFSKLMAVKFQPPASPPR